MVKRKSKTAGKALRKKSPSMAKMADLHVLYQKAVQSSAFEIEFYDDRYKDVNGKRKTPLILREDFCGQAGQAASGAPEADQRASR